MDKLPTIEFVILGICGILVIMDNYNNEVSVILGYVEYSNRWTTTTISFCNPSICGILVIDEHSDN